jgi:hypothetical protein
MDSNTNNTDVVQDNNSNPITFESQVFSGYEKTYTFNALDHVNVQYDICNHGESFKNLQDAYASFHNLKKIDNN